MMALFIALWHLMVGSLPGLDALAVVSLKEGGGHGSCTFVSRTKCLSAGHVADELKNGLKARGPDGSLYEVTGAVYGPADIAILYVDHPYIGPVPEVSCDPTYRGQPLYYYGNPLDIEFIGPIMLTVMGGTTDAMDPNGQDYDKVTKFVVRTNGESEGGVSGSGVFDFFGRVVGVYNMAWNNTTFGGFVSLAYPETCEWIQHQLKG